MKKFFRIVMLSINACCMLLLLLSYLGGITNPALRIGTAFYFFSLAYPVFVLLNIFFVAFWIYRKRWYFLLSLATIALGYNTFYNTFPIHFSKKELPPPGTLKVLTYNVGGFYNGEGNYLQTIDDVTKFIHNQHPDIFCMQEVNLLHRGRVLFSESKLFDKFKDYPHKAIHYLRVSYHGKLGVVLFSKYPLVKKGVIKISDEKFHDVLFADVQVKDQRIRVFVPHLNPNRLKSIDHDFYDELSQKDQEALKGEMEYLVTSLGKAAAARGRQVTKFKEAVNESPYPVIIAGDFNDTPATYTYRHLRKGLVDSKVENSAGLGATYNGNYPSFRIDYILHSPCFKSYDYRKYNMDISDHDAISCCIDMGDCE